MKEIKNLTDFRNTDLFREFYNISFSKFLSKQPYDYYSEGVYDYFEKLLVFVEVEDCIYKLDTACIIEHKSSSDSENNYYDEKPSMKEQLLKYPNYKGIIVFYRHSNSWNDDKVNERLWISRANIEKIIKEEQQEEFRKQEELRRQREKKVAEKVAEDDTDIRYLPEEDI
jgi:hypothetical protein